jgi:pentatricopeptide repeat protein
VRVVRRSPLRQPNNNVPLVVDAVPATLLEPPPRPAARPEAEVPPAAVAARVSAALARRDLDAAFAALSTSRGTVVGGLDASQHAAVSAAVAALRPELAIAYVAAHPDAGPPLFAALLAVLNRAPRGAFTEPAPDTAVYAMFIAAASRCGAFDAAAQAFRLALARGERGVPVFNAYISACGRAGRPLEAEAACAMMCAEGERPSAVTFNALISLHGAAGDCAAAQRVYDAMRAAGETATPRTFGALLAAHAAASPVDAAAAVALYDAAAAAGCAANGHIVSSLLTALARGCGAPRAPSPAAALALAHRAVDALLQYRGLDKVDARVWSALATLCGRAGDAAAALALLPRAGPAAAANPYVLAPVLAACRGSAEHAAAALEALAAAPPEARTTRVLNAALVLRAGPLGDLRGAMALAADMASGRAGPHAAPDAATFNTIIVAASQARNSGVAARAYREMCAARVAPDVRTFAALLAAVPTGRGMGGPERCLELLAEMRGLGLRPDEYCWTALVDSHVKAGELDAAFGAMDAMRAAGVAPTAPTFGAVLDGCNRTRDVQRALAVARDMAAAGVPPSDGCANLLVVACSHAGLLDEMLGEVRAVARRRGALQHDTLNAVLGALCRFQYAERALRIRAFMAQRGCDVTPAAADALAEACAREGLVTQAYDVLCDSAASGAPVSIGAASAVVHALCRAGEVDQALWVASRRGAGSVPPVASLQLHARPAPLPPAAADAEYVVTPAAMAALAAACARVRRLNTALEVYAQMVTAAAAAAPPETHTAGVGALLAAAGVSASSRRALYSALVEACCLQHRLEEALRAFDAAQDDPDAAALGMSTLTLASLEAACKRDARYEHRIYDVCAVMRSSRYAARQRKLAAPAKRCHHMSAEQQLNDS